MAKEIGRRPYVRPVPRVTWFLRHPRYVRYMLREITCFFIGGYTLYLLCGIARLSEGAAAYEAFLLSLRSPWAIVLLVLTLLSAIYHSVTWFNLTPRAMPIQIGERFLPDAVIAGVHYVGWLVLSAVVIGLSGVV